MPSSYIDLSYWQVAIAASLLLLNAAISLGLRQRLDAQLLGRQCG